jgi:hypothetical protein
LIVVVYDETPPLGRKRYFPLSSLGRLRAGPLLPQVSTTWFQIQLTFMAYVLAEQPILLFPPQCSHLSCLTPRRCHTIPPSSTRHPNPDQSTIKSQFVVAPELTNPHLRLRPQRVHSMQLAIINLRTSCKTKAQQLDTGMDTKRRSPRRRLPVSHSLYTNSSSFSPIINRLFASWSYIVLCCLNDGEVRHGVPLDADDDTMTSSTFQATPVAVSYLRYPRTSRHRPNDCFAWRVPVLSPSTGNTVSECVSCHPQRYSSMPPSPASRFGLRLN